MSPIRYAAFVLGALVALETTAVADPAPPNKRACSDAYTKAQVARKTGKLREAKKDTLVCGQASCPDFIKSSCSKWSSEIESMMPTIVVSAKDAHGSHLSDVSVTFDGEKLVDKLTGLPIPVDPGQHKLHFEHGSDKPVDQSIFINEGEKARVVDVTFGSATAGAASPAKSSGKSGSTDSGETASTGSGARTLSYVLGGLGVVGVAGFAYYGLKGKSEEDSARASCAPDCPGSRVDSIKTKYLIANISLGVGVVSLGLATYFFISSLHRSEARPGKAARLRFDIVGSSKGSFATLSGSF